MKMAGRFRIPMRAVSHDALAHAGGALRFNSYPVPPENLIRTVLALLTSAAESSKRVPFVRTHRRGREMPQPKSQQGITEMRFWRVLTKRVRFEEPFKALSKTMPPVLCTESAWRTLRRLALYFVVAKGYAKTGGVVATTSAARVFSSC